MGTFGGHALPGSFFVVFGAYWTVQIFRRYFAARRKPGATFTSSATFPLHALCPRGGGGCGPAALRRWEWEGCCKVFCALVGFLGEVITATHGGRFLYLGNGQHATMFFFFGEHAFNQSCIFRVVQVIKPPEDPLCTV